MADANEVMTALEYCRMHTYSCEHCPRMTYGLYCSEDLAGEALALLKKCSEVVMCKGCKHRQGMVAKIINGQVCFWCEMMKAYKPDGWYCADGERR